MAMKIKSLIGIGTIFMTAALPVMAQQGTLDKIKNSGAITIGHRTASVPFSYFDDKQQPIGYAMDLCMRIVDSIKSEVNLPNIRINYQTVDPATRIPLLANGTIDLECGSTTNNADRQQQISYTITHFVTANSFVSKSASGINSLADLKGKTVTSTSGTSNIRQLNELNNSQNLGMRILPARDHAEAFLMVDTGRAVAFVMDDILLAGLVATHNNPSQWTISKESLSVEPYGIMLRKGDAAFKAVVDKAMLDIYKSGEINKIYAKWFQSPIPPTGVNLNIPMSPAFKNVVANPTDSPDPAVYR